MKGVLGCWGVVWVWCVGGVRWRGAHPTYLHTPTINHRQTCKVTVDMDKDKKQGGPNTARISGSAAACALARERIEEVTQSVMEEAPVSEAL